MNNATKEKLEIIKQACDTKNAENIVEIDISGKTALADYFIIVNGKSFPQLDAIVNEIDLKMGKKGFEVKSKEGTAESGWVIMDYEDVIVHIFNSEQRSFYNIERLWSDTEK